MNGSTKTLKNSSSSSSSSSSNSNRRTKNGRNSMSLQKIIIPFADGINIGKELELKFGKRMRASNSSNRSTTRKKTRITSRNIISHNSLIGGKLLGEGGMSIIFSDPRLPSVGERDSFKYTDFQKNILSKQVSRLRKPMDSSKKDKEAALHPFILLKELLETKEDDAIKKRDLKFMKLNFGLPSNFDKFVLEDRPLFETIDKEFLKKEDRYYPNPEYYSNSEKNMYKEIISNKYDEHMIFDKALGDLKKNKLNINSVGMLLNYYKELRESIVPGIHFLHIHGLAHFDIKVDNIFVYKVDGKITFKLADFDLLTRIQDRVDNPKDNYILGVMRSDDYIYYPPAIDAYTYRKKLLKLAVTNYSRQPNTFEKKQTKLDATEQGNVSETVQHEPIPAANNIKSKFVNTDITNIRRDSELPDDTFAILSYRFYLTYMKTIIEKLNKYAEDINYFYILSINIDVLCKEHKLETSEIKKLIKEIAEIKYGVMDDGEFASGEISNIVYWENIEENVNKIYAYFAPGNSFNAVGFYSFIAKYTDIYAFCILLLNLLNSYIEEIVLKQDLWSLQKYVENVEFILQFIKTYLSVNAYLEPGMNVNIRSVEPIDIFNKAYNMFLSVLESKIK